MAIWKAENIVLTNAGREILSKVLAGNGNINVNRIVSGGGSVPFEELMSQTSVTDEKQTFGILNYTTNAAGSAIDLSLTNEGVSEEYRLNQIGIYVTHPDYPGEVLYLLAQCSEPDIIPVVNSVPISASYSIFMGHSGTENVNITLNSAGMVTFGLFNQHMEDTYAHAKAFASFLNDNFIVTSFKERDAGLPEYGVTDGCSSMDANFDLTYFQRTRQHRALGIQSLEPTPAPVSTINDTDSIVENNLVEANNSDGEVTVSLFTQEVTK